MKSPKIGVLALQGAFFKHAEMLHDLGAVAVEIRKPEQLRDCQGLILPGGESTTMQRRIDFIGMSDALHEFAQSKPVFGTCAGLILMSKSVVGESQNTFGWLDVVVERNGYGRQIESFGAKIDFQITSKKTKPFHGVFIRAPRIQEVGRDVEVLASYNDEAIAVRQGNYLATSFHPELTEDSSIHAYFLKNLLR